MEEKKFQCVQCGACCRWEGPVRLTDEEIDRIAAFLNLTSARFLDEFVVLAPDRRCLSLSEQKNGACVFYDCETKKCRINPVKPKQCRDFPLRWNFPGWERLCGACARDDS